MFNKLAADVFNVGLAPTNLITKTDFDAKLLSLKKTKKKLKTFDSSYFIGKSHFEEDGTQNYLVFQPIEKYVKMITNTDYISSGKLKDYLMKAPT